MSNRVILHLGTAKTGTTALQEFLHDNSDILDALGYAFPIFDDMVDDYFASGIVNALPVMHAFDDRELNESKQVIWNNLINRIKDELIHRNVILSSEILWMWPNLKDFIVEMKERFLNVEVIVYLRRQDEYIEALWNHYIKVGGEYRELFDFCSSVEIEACSYIGKLKMLEDELGIESVNVRIYEKGNFHGDRNDIVSDFLYALGEEIELPSIDYLDINKRLQGYSMELNRVYNEVLFDISEKEQRSTLFDISYNGAFVRDDRGEFFRELSFLEEPKTASNYFSDEQRDELKAKYEDENRIILSRYIEKRNNEGLIRYNHFLWKDCLKQEEVLNPSKTDNRLIKMIFLLYLKESMKNKVILRKATRGRIIALYGANAVAKKLIQEGSASNCDLIIDTFSTRKSLENIKICAPKDIDEWKKYYIVVTTAHYDEVSKMLNSIGLIEYEDYIYWSEYY